MEDIAIRKLFTLLSACTNNHTPMIQILKEKLILSEEYQLLSSLDQYFFLSDQGRDLKKRIRDFKIIQPDNLASAYNLLNNLTSLASEFKNVLAVSKSNVEVPINRSYREAHILEKGYLQKTLERDKTTLETSEVYLQWQDKNNYYYENEAAYELKEEMDYFKCDTETLAEIHQSYVALEAFQNRFQQNRDWIVSHEEYVQREKALNEEKKRRRKAWISKNYPGWLLGLDVIVVIGVIIYIGNKRGIEGVLVAIFVDVVGGVAICFGGGFLLTILSVVTSFIVGEDAADNVITKLAIWGAFILVILYQVAVLGSAFDGAG